MSIDKALLTGRSSNRVFTRFGRSLHLRIDDAADLRHVLELDEAHWISTSAPIVTINADPAFLALLDGDGDGRVRVEELRSAVSWLLAHLNDHSRIRDGNTGLELASVDPAAPDGEEILLAAGKVCDRLGDTARSSISLGEVRSLLDSQEAGGLGYPGLVLPEAAPDGVVRGFLHDVLATMGGEEHPNGATGVDAKVLAKFSDEARAYLAWHDRAGADGDRQIMPLGDETPRVFALYQRLREPLDRFFALCELQAVASFTPMEQPSTGPAGKLESAGSDDLRAWVERAPLATPTASGVLDLDGDLNPRFADDLRTFRELCLDRLPGAEGTRLTAARWEDVKYALAAHSAWAESCPQTRVAEIDIARLRAYATEPEYYQAALALLEASQRRAIAHENLRLVEKLILYQAYLLPMANSFVSFPDLYDPESRALFEMGTLIMDGRHFTLSVRVPDRERHVRLSQQSNIFMLYVEVSGADGSEPYEIAVPVTSGGKGRLQVGSWGIFQDIEGNERHARVVAIVENPISLTEAVAAPFKRLGRTIAKKLQEITSAAEEKLSKVGSETVTKVTDISTEKQPGGGSGGMLAGGGIAIAALGSSAAFITKTLSTLSWQGALGGLTLAALAVLLPTALFAWLRLRSRDLSSLLEGAGWAVNDRMWLTPAQARTFTFEPRYSSGMTSARELFLRWRPLFALVLIGLLLWAAEHFGLLAWLYGVAAGAAGAAGVAG
jgi:hypothetical protein